MDRLRYPNPLQGATKASGSLPEPLGGRSLRLLSYNIQTGISSERYRHYLTNSWKHLLPHPSRQHNLDLIAHGLEGFDIVGLQEVDSGSLRTGFVNQTQYLADRAQFPFWHHQVNRRLGKFAQHSNGLLTRIRVHALTDLKLPGIPGRGAMLARLGGSEEPLALFILHLALGKRARLRQLAYLAERINAFSHAVLMGDLNCEPHSDEVRLLLEHTCLRNPAESLCTFPSWRPRRHIDHILVTPQVSVDRVHVLEWPFSDHLPIAMEITVPNSIRL